MATVHIRWVPEKPAGQTQHEKELELSAQRAHSARVTHIKRKRQKTALLERRASSAQKLDTGPAKPSGNLLQIIPSPLLSRGSSDPFGALLIPSTPAVKRVVAFLREAYTPCVYIPNWLRQSPDADVPLPALIASRALAGSCGVLRDFQNCFDYPEVQPAWMSSNLSAVMEFLPPEDKPQLYGVMLQCRQRSIQILRKAIREQTKVESAPKISLLLQITLLFREGYMLEHPQTPEAYRIVSEYIEKAYVDTGTALNMLIIAMYNDAELACKRLRRTILNFETWLTKWYEPFWAYVESYLPPAPAHVLENLHPSLANVGRIVYRAIARTRRLLDLSETMDPLTIQLPGDYMAGDLRWAWMASTGLHDMGLLVNQYCSLKEIRGGIKDKQDLWNHDLRTAVTLATLFNLRKLIQSASCNGVDLREAQLIVPTLEKVLKRALEYSSEEQRWDSRDVLMWMYFSGAWHGQNIHYQRRRSVFGDRSTTFAWPNEYDATWFNKQLSLQAHRLWLTRWYDTRDFLRRFTYSDLIRPHPIQWYESIVTDCSTRNAGGNSDAKVENDALTSSKPRVNDGKELSARKRGVAPIEDLIARSDTEK